MVKIRRGTTTKKKHKKIFKATKGMSASRKNSIKRAHEALLIAQQNAYFDRKTKKGNFRRLWIIRINAILKNHDLTYSKFINLLKKNKIEVDRKILADLAANEPKIFEKIVNEVKK